MIKKRKRRKKSKKAALLRNAEEDEELTLINNNRKGTKKPFKLPQKRKKVFLKNLYEPPKKKFKVESNEEMKKVENSRSKMKVEQEFQMKNDYFFQKDAKERRMRKKFDTEDFVEANFDNKLRASNIINDDGFDPGEYYENSAPTENWEFSKMKSALGSRNIGFMKKNQVRKPPQVDPIELPSLEDGENEDLSPPKTVDEMMKLLELRISKYREREKYLSEQKMEVDEELGKQRKALEHFKKDEKSIHEEYVYYQSIQKWCSGVMYELEEYSPKIYDLRTDLFKQQEKHYLNVFETQQAHNEIFMKKALLIQEEAMKIQGKLNERNSLPSVRQKFEEWKSRYPHSYFDAHIGLCARKFFQIYVTLELLCCGYDPFQSHDFFKFEFWKELLDYGRSTSQMVDEENDYDEEMIPSILMKCVVPFIRSSILYKYNPFSSEATRKLQRSMIELGIIVGDLDEYKTTIKDYVIDRFEYACSNFQRNKDSLSGERKMVGFSEMLGNLGSWTKFDRSKVSTISIEKVKVLVTKNILKENLFPSIVETSKTKYDNEVARRNFRKKKYQEVLELVDYPVRWKQSINALAHNAGIF